MFGWVFLYFGAAEKLHYFEEGEGRVKGFNKSAQRTDCFSK